MENYNHNYQKLKFKRVFKKLRTIDLKRITFYRMELKPPGN